MILPERENRTFKFSQRLIETLPIPPANHPSSNIEYTDSVESGLKIAFYKSGLMTFRFRYTFNGRKSLLTIGDCRLLTIEQARQKVRGYKKLLLDGLDPAAEKERVLNAPTVQEFVDSEFLPRALRERKSIKDMLSRLNGHVLTAFGKKQLSQISKRDVMAFHQRLCTEKSNTTANRSKSLFSSILQLAVEMEILTENPCLGIKKAKENGPRKRVLTGEELPRFMASLMKATNSPSGMVLSLLIFTGLRKSEVTSLAWANIDLEQCRLFIPNPKNGVPRWVGVNSMAVELLKQMAEDRGESPWLFPSDSAEGHLLDVRRTFKSVCRVAKIEGFRIHDIRRCVASILCESGENLIIIRDLLGHADVRTTQIYTQLSTTAQKAASESTVDRLRKALDQAA